MKAKGNKYVCIRKNAFNKYLENYNLIESKTSTKVKTTVYENPENQLDIEEFKNGLIIVNSLKQIEIKSLVDVSKNELYKAENIDKLKIKNIIFEGTDGVGKTSTIIGLINLGIVCLDRSEEICKYMLFDVDKKTRCEAYKKYLEESPYKVIFLINNSKEELERRIYSRKEISDFDKLAYEYNLLYKDTYEAMQKYDVSNKLEMIDCTNLSLEEQINKVKKYILED